MHSLSSFCARTTGLVSPQAVWDPWGGLSSAADANLAGQPRACSAGPQWHLADAEGFSSCGGKAGSLIQRSAGMRIADLRTELGRPGASCPCCVVSMLHRASCSLGTRRRRRSMWGRAVSISITDANMLAATPHAQFRRAGPGPGSARVSGRERNWALLCHRTAESRASEGSLKLDAFSNLGLEGGGREQDESGQ